MGKIIFVFLIISSIIFPCYGDTSRQELISYTLDCYSLDSGEKKQLGREKEKAVEKLEREMLKKKRAERKRLKKEELKKQKAERERERAEKNKLEKEILEKKRAEKKKLEEEKAKEEELKAYELTRHRSKEVLREFLQSLHFYTKGRVVYNDNVYLTHSDEESDLITEATVGLRNRPKISWETKRERKTEFFFDLSSDVLGYSSASTSDNVFYHANLFLNHKLTDKYGLDLYYKRDTAPDTATNLFDTEDKKIVTTEVQRYGVGFNAAWNRFPWDITYSHTDSFYNDEEYSDSEFSQDVISLTGYLRLLSKTDFLWSYEYGEVEYPKRDDQDYAYNSYWLGVRGKISPKITGLMRFGWGNFDYENGTSKDREGIDVRLNYRFSPRLLFDFGLYRHEDASSLASESSKEHSVYFWRCRYLPPFNKRLVLEAEFSYGQKDYSSGREDELYILDLTATYKFRKWLSFEGGYKFKQRTSSRETSEYKNNIFVLGCRSDF